MATSVESARRHEVHDAMQVWRGDASGGVVRGLRRRSPGRAWSCSTSSTASRRPRLPTWPFAGTARPAAAARAAPRSTGRPRLMCMTRMDIFEPGETDHCRADARPFRCIKDLVTDVSFNYEKAKTVPAFKPKPKEADGTRRMYQEDVDRVQEFHKCIECFLCQNVCHVIRDHEENKPAFAGPRLFVRLAALEMHPLDTNDRRKLLKEQAGLGFCNITKCCTEVCPEHIHITDNAIIPLKERVVTEFHDPVVWAWRKLTGKDGEQESESP